MWLWINELIGSFYERSDHRVDVASVGDDAIQLLEEAVDVVRKLRNENKLLKTELAAMKKKEQVR